MKADGFDIVGDGFRATYRHARRGLKDAWADPSPANFHAWRKRVKAHMYHYRLFRRAWPPVMKKWQDELATLAALLGEEHDLTVLRDHLTQTSAALLDAEVLMSMLVLADARQNALRSQAVALGRRLFAEKPYAHLRRLSIWWTAARDTAAGPGSR